MSLAAHQPLALTAPVDVPGLTGRSAPMQALAAAIARIAVSDAPVVVTGETGSGKERAARAIHAASPRADGPFVVVDCASVVASLFESEMFGHEPGAFTDARGRSDGAFRRAQGGTLFLDELGELPLPAQAKLLRALDSGEIKPVGGVTERIDVRVVAATHRNLRARVASGAFREDLYYRLAVLTVRVPALRERPEDLPLLVAEILDSVSADAELTRGAFAALRALPWPGNVRELRNVLVRLALLGPGPGAGPGPVRIDGQALRLAVDAGALG